MLVIAIQTAYAYPSPLGFGIFSRVKGHTFESPNRVDERRKTFSAYQVPFDSTVFVEGASGIISLEVERFLFSLIALNREGCTLSQMSHH